MSKFSRVINVLKSLLMIIIGLIILLVPDDTDYIIVCCILGFVVLIRGFKKLFFYFSSAKNMVGGRRILINSIINIDLGLISFIILQQSQGFAMLYMVAVFMLLGAVDILRSFEIKKNGSKSWIIKLIKGILTVAIGIGCLIFASNVTITLMVFGASWVVLAIEGFITAFSKSAVAYIPEI